jgi:hypothetical protein
MRNILLLAVLVILAGCNKPDQPMPEEYYLVYDGGNDVATLLKKLDGSSIYFGHQSVGYNIMEGVEHWYRASGLEPGIAETRIPGDRPAVFMHFPVGRNHEPFSKIADFESLLSEIPDSASSMALFKFCYVDIVDTTDVESLFAAYKESMLRLREAYPCVKIVLVTAPYTGIQTGPRALVKRVLFMPLAGELENMKRHEFNKKLVDELGGLFPVFDLARIESTLPDGGDFTYRYKGGRYPALVYAYTDDLGHLNTQGSRLVAHNLIAYLAQLGEPEKD